MKTKKGISLVVLTITLIVMAILAGLIIINMVDSTKEANRVAFMKELKTVLEACNGYFLENGELPIVQGIEYSKNDLLNIVPQNSSLIQEEMNLNKDNSDKYYKVDLSLLNAKGGLVGATSDAGDFFVINKNVSQIYYLKGFEIGNELYFSLSSKLDPSMKIIEDSFVQGNIHLVSNTTAIILTKSTNNYTGELTINIKATVLNGEKIEIDILGDVISEFENVDSTITISNVTLTDLQKDNLKTSPVITANKINSEGRVVATTTLDVSNLDCQAPTVQGEPEFKGYDDYNLINLKNVSDDKSGFKNIYYMEESETETLTAIDIKTNGKMVSANYIRLYNHITKVKAVFEDAAGNVSGVYNITVPSDLISLYGDLNSDGEVNVVDSVLLAQYLAENKELTGLQKALADVNLNGVVDSEDAEILADYLAEVPTVPELPVFENVENEM
ncbi:MAG: hypothetical protein IKV94_04145 [Clostridia bacterium]|nr:hypothetical protein [Clostridia bacterium]